MFAETEEFSKYRAALVARPMATGRSCPLPEELWEAVWGSLDRKQVAELADHTSECGHCALAWRLAVELRRGRDLMVQPLRPPRVRSIPTQRWWGGALAAAAAILMTVTLSWQDFGKRPESGLRGVQAPEAGAISSLLPEGVPISREQCVLRWTSLEPGATYSIKVSDELARPLVEVSGLTVTEYHVPSDKLASVAPGGVVFWVVEATGSDGTPLGPQLFELTLQ